MRNVFQRIAIIGVGLIGGSLGLAIKKDKFANHVIGIDINQANLELAQQLGAIDQASLDYDLISTVDLVILAAPITVNLKVLRQIEPLLKPGAIITDVCSTKGDFVRECGQILTNNPFVGGHPMAGAEVAGVGGADPYLFENAIYLLTPTTDTDPAALTKVKTLVEGIGARVMIVDPDEHDFMVAAVSHLPHLVASTLVNTAAELEDDHPLTLVLAAGGFKDTTRIASGNPTLWKDICFNNQDKLVAMIERFEKHLASFKMQLTASLDQEFEADLQLAKNMRDKIPKKLKGYWPFLEELIVTIPDQPGTIGLVAVILGQQGINIDDIEILHVREGEGGTLRLGFAQEDSASKAMKTLKKHGFVARIKDIN